MNYSVKILDKLRISFLQKQELDYTFSNNISSNYLKIISNLFYLVLRKVSVSIKRKFIDDFEYANKLEIEKEDEVRKEYTLNLEEKRNEVFKFFKVEDDSLITSRCLVRVFTHSLSVNDPIRVKYLELNSYLNQIESNMVKNIFAEEFIIDVDENNKVLDIERDLKSLTTNVIDYKNIEM